MNSYRRIQASRCNGSKSRGPTTPEAKHHSSGNATTHGLLSDCIVLPGESRDGFEALLEEYLARFGPRDGVELSIIEEMTACYWRMRRAWFIENGLLKEGIASQTSGDNRTRIMASFRGLAASPDLALLHRYEARLHRMYQRALNNIVLLRTIELPNEPSPISEHSLPVPPVLPPETIPPPDTTPPPVVAPVAALGGGRRFRLPVPLSSPVGQTIVFCGLSCPTPPWWPTLAFWPSVWM